MLCKVLNFVYDAFNTNLSTYVNIRGEKNALVNAVVCQMKC